VNLTQETRNLFRLTRFGIVNCFLVHEGDGKILLDSLCISATISLVDNFIWSAAASLPQAGLPPLFLRSDIDLTHPNLKLFNPQRDSSSLNYVNP
jgi:hypothetical protein